MNGQGNRVRGAAIEAVSVNRSRECENRIKRLLILCIITVFLVFGACALFGNILSSAHAGNTESPARFKYYTSIEIQPGDTLWDIAKVYITEDYESVPEYVQALKEINSLDTDNIEAGQNLIVAYNDTKFKK
ncbi:MAG: LysM peptidoglycan-binding domain-containing protein [Faecalicatena sp.]|uniref:LysM peptidoglycan-binding domain-containing protein n=1 Tax=Faecalicatena sp. TaxID=2005360 RepID=UPI0025870A7D|nr:LysM peptidoglycan-binding domain-containing protein [Faecalicatena sp.]MCI6467188.1 LysM peptidoglycan-binding domain-containing protein [Faecalicatena sp.]MDY5620193.1 LysM peptidoglycan-binding domain-containing protein [Lachnospiraceae bacterium]